MNIFFKILAFAWIVVFFPACSSGNSQDDKQDLGASDSKLKIDKQPLKDAPLADIGPDHSSLPEDSQPASDSQPAPDSQPASDSKPPPDVASASDHSPLRDAPLPTDAHLEAQTQSDLPQLPDQNQPLEATVSPDFSTGTLSCSEVYICAQACTSADPNCLPGCIAQGCGSATDTVIADFVQCFYDSCFSECYSSFDTACQTCIHTYCSAEASACSSHQC